jgi:uncharacterized phiE125 gp8 family phage protein
MGLRLTSAPATEPVTLVEAKAHLRLETSADDTYVTSLIVAARQYVEEVCWRGLIAQTWELTLDDWPSTDQIDLPRGEVTAITSVKYDDATGAEQTLASSNYTLDGYPPARLVLKSSASWPDLDGEVLAIRILFVVGWANAAAVPMPIKQAVLLLVSQLYEQRTPEVTGAQIAKVDFAVDALLRPYRLVRL